MRCLCVFMHRVYMVLCLGTAADKMLLSDVTAKAWTFLLVPSRGLTVSKPWYALRVATLCIISEESTSQKHSVHPLYTSLPPRYQSFFCGWACSSLISLDSLSLWQSPVKVEQDSLSPHLGADLRAVAGATALIQHCAWIHCPKTPHPHFHSHPQFRRFPLCSRRVRLAGFPLCSQRVRLAAGMNSLLWVTLQRY